MRSRFATPVVIAVYLVVMLLTNTRFTLLDDEASSIAIAGRPIIPTLQLFFSGQGMAEEHPPGSNMLLHLWLLATHYSFFLLRAFANLFFIAAVIFLAKSAEKIAGPRAYWAVLAVAFLWPFAFQYGRIAGWYCVSMFFLCFITWAYLCLLDDRGSGAWIAFTVSSVLLVWTNYFGFVFLFLLLADFFLFHRGLAYRRVIPLLVAMSVIALAFFPLLINALRNLAAHAAPLVSRLDWKNEFAVFAYPSFAIFASAAVAPWFLPLSLPVFAAVLVLVSAIWLSPGRRWLIYFLICMAVLQISGQMDIKRVLFLLPWLFLAMGLSICAAGARHPRLAAGALAVVVACGWAGILSGRHYATTNLYEPWHKVAQVVARDARAGATIVSENPTFFSYLDYQLGLQAETKSADGSYLGEALYRAHRYTIFMPDADSPELHSLRGRVVYVIGTGDPTAQSALNDQLRSRCTRLGEYHAAPDPAALWKLRFANNVPVLRFRTEVIWYQCPDTGTE